MILLRLAWRSLLNRRTSVLLAAAMIAVSVCLLLAVDKLRRDARRSFFHTVSGVDLIVGARTSQLQLLLASVFHIGEPLPPLTWATAREIARMPGVRWMVPLSLGDRVRDFRVVGTSTALFEHFRHGEARTPLSFASGAPFDDGQQAVLGASAARSLGLAPGASVVLSHDQLHAHDQAPFTVTGVLAATGTPLDRSVLVPLGAIARIHADWEHGPPRAPLRTDRSDRGQDATAPAHSDAPGPDSPPHTHAAHSESAAAVQTPADALQSVSALLLGLDSPVAALGLQARIQRMPGAALVAALPGASLQQLWSLTAVAEQALLLIAAAVALAGLFGMLLMLLSTLDQRRREMALLRSVGAGPAAIAVLLLLECALLLLAGIALGVLLLALLAGAVADWLLATHGVQLSNTLVGPWGWQLLGGLWLAGLLLALLPAILASRRALADGLSVRL